MVEDMLYRATTLLELKPDYPVRGGPTVGQQAHNLCVGGSNPPSATIFLNPPSTIGLCAEHPVWVGSGE